MSLSKNRTAIISASSPPSFSTTIIKVKVVYDATQIEQGQVIDGEQVFDRILNRLQQPNPGQ
ncbi:MAG: hypothetical protein P5680_01415 [Limnospira sp. PMC 737.11]|uniref:hypothetical protein n=1 Tax=Limnospira sp. PMC 737.11 TaxID=2981095 RepID=UPI0028E18581|nr:hypothetical protein [Limnospira sp. PMC 737.11]MDT9273237.1 hypothetical protein [Limnospira sp. PMC 737.11]